MMYDVLCVDVFVVFVVQFGDGVVVEQVCEDLQEYSQWFCKVVEQNQGLFFNDVIYQVLVELWFDLEVYIGVVESIVGKVLFDFVVVWVELLQFVQVFKELEGCNEVFSSLIEKYVEQINWVCEDSMCYFVWMFVGGILVVCLVFGQFCCQLLCVVLQLLCKLVLLVWVIVQGNLQELIGVDSNDEVGQLQWVLGEMQENLWQMIIIICQESEEFYDIFQFIGQILQLIVYGVS